MNSFFINQLCELCVSVENRKRINFSPFPTKNFSGVSLLEILIALSILSTIFLPVGMYMLEYVKGNNELGSSHQVMNVLEEKMETALAQPFSALPIGNTEGRRISYQGKEVLDLRPMEFGEYTVKFSMNVEMVPVEFSAVVDSTSGQVERSRLEESMKKIFLKAIWGKKREHSYDLTAYKADL